MPGITRAPEAEQTAQEQKTPHFHVVLLDDDDHTYDYVIEMLQRLFIMSKNEAFEHAREVDETGRTIVMTCDLPAAEFARDQIHAYGADPRLARSKGSMSAVIEPAGTDE